MIKHLAIPAAFICGLMLPASGAAAECYADYKAKQDSPLRLHYGVLQLSGDCARGPAATETKARLQSHGWTLLNVVSVFGPEGLAERKESAGSFYLRF